MLFFLGFVVGAQTMSLEDAKAFLADKEKRVDEGGAPPYQTSWDLAFHRFVAEDWKRALALLEKDAPDLRRQSLILVAAQYLQPKDYVHFLNGTCALMESGKLKIEGWAFCYRDRYKRGFLEYNYDQPEVAAVIDRMMTIYQAQEPEGPWEKYFSDIKSGESKKRVERVQTFDGWLLPETYKDNPQEVFRWLLKEQKRFLAEEAKKAKGRIKPEPVPKERKPVRIAEEDGSVRIVLMDDDPPEDEPVEDNVMSWKLPLFIGTLFISSIAVAWHCFQKKRNVKTNVQSHGEQ